MFLLNRTARFLSKKEVKEEEPVYPIISCVDATEDTGFIKVDGTWDLVLNGQKVLESSPTLAVLNFLQATGNFDIIIDDEVEFTSDFDFVVVSYTWTAANGIDLDTRTSITQPPRNYEVGWQRGSVDQTYLTWAGDNTSEFGPESVLVDIASIKRDYPTQKSIQVLLKAFWFSQAFNGDCNLSFVTYKGGSMESDGGYGFVNNTGVVVDRLTIQVNTLSNDRDGQPLGFLNIDLESGKSLFTMYSGQPIPPVVNKPVEGEGAAL